LDDRKRDGGTNFILRIKEQETRLTLHEHDDDDEVVPKRRCGITATRCVINQNSVVLILHSIKLAVISPCTVSTLLSTMTGNTRSAKLRNRTTSPQSKSRFKSHFGGIRNEIS